ncbi:MAG: hypothetical protein U0271_09395 [Polyangiaceae bacterium]
MSGILSGTIERSGGRRVRLGLRRRLLPVVVIPDLFMTRLKDPGTDQLVWNPSGFPMTIATSGPFVIQYGRLLEPTELVPATDFYDRSDPEKVVDHHAEAPVERIDQPIDLGALVLPFYDLLLEDLLVSLTDRLSKDHPELDLGVRVYCFGYDWRLDLCKSAARLSQYVDRVLAETGESQCVLVAHGMGGSVARYYSRVLAGEPKIFAMHLLGSPILGAPEMFVHLKHGLPGAYVKDYFHVDPEEEDDVAATVQGALTDAGNIAAAIATAASGGVANVGYLTLLYMLLVHGAGRCLTRAETVAFLRAMPSIFQSMPHAIYCDRERHWMRFDPWHTAYPQRGYVVMLPTPLDPTTIHDKPTSGENPWIQVFGAEIARAEERARSSASVEQDTRLTRANKETFAEAFIGLMTIPEGKVAREAYRLGARIQAIMERILKHFINSRNPVALYNDIFVGLLDRVDLRPLSKLGLDLARRFEDSLTLNPSMPAPETLTAAFTEAAGRAVANSKTQTDAMTALKKRLDERPADRAAVKIKPRAYVHPRTSAYATSDIAVESGGTLACLDVRSSYDANSIVWSYLPTPPFATPPATPDATGAAFWGDGAVPLLSACPPDELVSSPLSERFVKLSQVPHAELAVDATVRDELVKGISAEAREFYGLPAEDAS